MRTFALFIMFLAALGTNANAATPNQRRGGATATTASSGGATSARSAVSARSATRTGAPAAPAVAARSATTGRTTVARGAAPAAKNTGVAARAATKQKVISTGTKVTSATQNVVVSEECRQKYEGCMDSFCMLDNTTGGRCICSDKNAELNDILAQIEKLDQQSYQMATFGVEKIEMGDDAEAAIAKANAAAQSVITQENEEKQTKKNGRKSLDLSAWNTLVDFDSDDVFEEAEGMQSMIDGKEGDALHRAAAQICTEQIPECGNDISMLQMMYSQKIRSDCTAYENSLKQQKTASAQKLSAAEQALREAALEQLHIANKYDLGQCTTEFKKCMITTGGCGEDFSNCASVAAIDNTNTTKSSKQAAKMYSIKGSATTIEIFASTYDTLEAKKPLCMGITDSCVAVKDQVWTTFLREVAPQIKSAELIAEDKARQDCIGNISACFQKACKDNIDPNDPDGSYDMCLSRPETMLNVCKIPLNACGIDTDPNKASESQIWQFVVARLASMRVDSCTKEVKECLTSEDRCGEDYSQCVGLDTDSIIRMCPYEKLTGCVEKYGAEKVTSDDVYDKLADMVQGIMLNIDNNMLTQCQNAANEAMIKVCGDTENCNGLAVDDDIGARSLEYKICQYNAGQNTPNYNSAACYASADAITESVLRDDVPIAGVLSGLIFWNSIEFDEDGKLTDMNDYIQKTGLQMTESQQSRMRTELESLQTNIQSAIQTIEADPTVQFCMTGREVQGMRRSTNKDDEPSARDKIGEKSEDAARFPGLTKQMRQTIAIAALQAAKDNYYKKYDEFSEKMLQDFQTVGQKLVELNKDDNLDIKREAGRVACNNLAYFWHLSKASSPSAVGSTIDTSTASSGVFQDAYIMPFTGNDNGLRTTEEKRSVIAGKKLKAESRISNLSLIQKTTTTYNWDTMMCQKCITEQHCTKVKGGLFRKRKCHSWTDAKTTCSDIQL